MAKQIITKITDDLDGGEADETVSFALDGSGYEIDLSAKNAAKLRDYLAAFIDAGTRTGRVGQNAQVRPYARSAATQSSVSTRATRATREENQAIRAWAMENRFDLAERGRIPQHIVDAYHQRRHNVAALKQESDAAAAAVPAKAATRKRAGAGSPQFASA